MLTIAHMEDVSGELSSQSIDVAGILTNGIMKGRA
jgi:hypothetical protein